MPVTVADPIQLGADESATPILLKNRLVKVSHCVCAGALNLMTEISRQPWWKGWHLSVQAFLTISTIPSIVDGGPEAMACKFLAM